MRDSIADFTQHEQYKRILNCFVSLDSIKAFVGGKEPYEVPLLIFALN